MDFAAFQCPRMTSKSAASALETCFAFFFERGNLKINDVSDEKEARKALLTVQNFPAVLVRLASTQADGAEKVFRRMHAGTHGIVRGISGPGLAVRIRSEFVNVIEEFLHVGFCPDIGPLEVGKHEPPMAPSGVGIKFELEDVGKRKRSFAFG